MQVNEFIWQILAGIYDFDIQILKTKNQIKISKKKQTNLRQSPKILETDSYNNSEVSSFLRAPNRTLNQIDMNSNQTNSMNSILEGNSMIGSYGFRDSKVISGMLGFAAKNQTMKRSKIRSTKDGFRFQKYLSISDYGTYLSFYMRLKNCKYIFIF